MKSLEEHQLVGKRLDILHAPESVAGFEDAGKIAIKKTR
jgi:hypothetical protein